MGMGGDDDDVPPRPNLWARLERHLSAPRPPVDVRRYEWLEVAPGLKSHVLEDNSAAGYVRLLIWLEADVLLPRHRHDGDEDVLVLEGGIVLEGENEGTHLAGSIFRSRAGTGHQGRATPGRDCVGHVVMYSARKPDS